MTETEIIQATNSMAKMAMAVLQADYVRKTVIQKNTAIFIQRDGKRVRVTNEEHKKVGAEE